MSRTKTSILFTVALTVSRLVLAAWVGAAMLYVITSIAEQTSEHFDSTARDRLATIRFPLYYQFGLACYVLAAVSAVVAVATAPAAHRKRMAIVVILILLSAAVFAFDYVKVYQPLQQLIIPPGKARTTDFITLHRWSRHINEVHLLLMLAAGIIGALPLRPVPASDE